MSQPFPSVTLESGHIDRVSIPTLASSTNSTWLHIDILRPCLQRYPLERTRAKPEPHLKKSLQPCRWESSSPTLVSARTVYQRDDRLTCADKAVRDRAVQGLVAFLSRGTYVDE